MGRLATHLASQYVGHPLRVGVDGVCGAGKTTFARELAQAVRERGRGVILLDSDGFHHVRARRYRQGRDSARGYYEDAYDLEALAERVLVPLGPGGTRQYAEKVHDLASDAVISDRTATAEPDAVLIAEMTFLQRGALRALWEEVVFLDVDLAVATERAVARDAVALGGESAARAAYSSRYRAACEIYLAEERPAERASILIAHDDPARPRILRGPA